MPRTQANAEKMPDDAASGMATMSPKRAPQGRRERKKAATRKSISDAATALFVERGFDRVSTKEIADAADVSPTTVFAHFPTKEALVFDEDEQQRDELLAAVSERPLGSGVTQALHGYFQDHFDEESAFPENTRAQFQDMIASTPALSDYWKRMWMRYGDALANLLATEAGQVTKDGSPDPAPELQAFARMALQVQLLAMESDAPKEALNAGFTLLEPGWAAYASTVGLS